MIRYSILVILLTSFSFCETETKVSAEDNIKPVLKNNAEKQPVVIELFSSEGCSSCPPAAVVADELVSKAERENKPVYLLDFHVDYWDYLGWKDTLAKPEFTQRQSHYVQALGLKSAYTPQAIVNGKKQAVGSDRKKLETFINEESNSSTGVNLSCNGNSNIPDGSLTVQYTVTGKLENSVICYALFYKIVKDKILRGENEEKTLSHKNAVFYIVQDDILQSTGSKTLAHLPADKSNYGLLVFIQNKNTMQITASCALKIN